MADTWTTKTALPEGRYQHGGASVGTDKGYISGGSAGANHHKEYTQSGDSWAAKTVMPGNMANWPGSASIGSDKLYVTGAMNHLSNYE